MTLRLFKFFNRLGKHSLQVFAYSLFVTAAFSKVGQDWVGLPGAARVVLALVVVLSLVIPAWLHEIYRSGSKFTAPGVGYPTNCKASPHVCHMGKRTSLSERV